MAPIDITNPVHRASFFVEDVKWGKGNWGNSDPEANAPPQALGREEAIEHVQSVVDAGGLSLDATLTVDTVAYFAASWEEQTGLPAPTCLALFYDGFLLGMATAAGLEGDVPEVYQVQDVSHDTNGDRP